jgi:hypothetical protein
MPNLNNNITSNRGVELILSGGKTKKPKLFHIIFEKLISILKREVTIYFEFSLQLRKVN